MATKTINGSYPTGYYLDPAYQALNIDAAATVGGTGVTTTATQSSTIQNLGTIQGTANGITLSDGGAITNGSSTNSAALIAGKTAVMVNGAAATIDNYAVIQNTSSYVYHGAVVSGPSIVLNDGGTVTNRTTGQIANGVVVSMAAGTIVNNGTIGAPTTVSGYLGISDELIELGQLQTGYSVQLNAGGSVTNGTSSITSASISNGIQIAGGAGTVTNDGTIGGVYRYVRKYQALYYSGGYGPHISDGFVENGSATGVSVSLLNGGTVTNGTGGNTAAVISNGIVISGGAGTVLNHGTIGGGPGYNESLFLYFVPVPPSSTFSIDLQAGGNVTNGSLTDATATITDGIHLGGASSTVVNYAVIQGGIFVAGAATIDNYGMIGGTTGIDVAIGASSLVTNFAEIEGTGGTAISFADAGDRLIEESTGTLVGKVSGGTVELAADTGAGSFTTAVSGSTVIVDADATWSLPGASAFTSAAVVNYGTLAGIAGTALSFGAASDRLVDEGSGVFDGTVSGGGGTLELDGKAGAGTLTGLGSSFTGFGTITVDSGAIWNLSGPSAVALNTVLGNAGTLTLSGQVVSSGQITNLAGATLAFGGDYSITTDPAVKAGQFTNAGLVEKLSGTGTSIIRTGAATLTDSGTIDVETGLLELTGAAVGITGLIKGAGAVEFSTGATTLGVGAAITTAALKVVGTGAKVTVASALSYAGAFMQGAGTELILAAKLTLSGPASFSRATIDGTSQLATSGAVSLGPMTLGGSVIWQNTGTITATGQLTVDAGLHISVFDNQKGIFDLAGNAGIDGSTTSSFSNRALFEKTVGGLSRVGIAMANTGTIESASGTLDFQKAVTGSNGTLKIDAGKVIEADAAVSSGQTVKFNGGSDRLVLTEAADFAATLSNFGSGDKLDLRQFHLATTTLGFTENAAHTAGTLTVTDGALVATIALLGQYTATAFHKSSDGVGGIFITYTPAPALIAAPRS